MSTTVSYKGNTLATVSNNTKTLETEGKYLEADIILTDVSQAAPVLETVAKSYTPTESQQTETITPGVGNDGIAEVDVTVGAISSSYVGSGITRRDNTDLSASGATVSVPSGYYENNVSKAVASGTEGTPTATKGAVSSHSITFFPSVTNVAGYISGGTHTGTGVTVSASELVSGSQTVTQNGTVDCTNLAEIVVDVSGGGGSQAVAGRADGELITASSSIVISGLLGEPTSYILWADDNFATGASPFKVQAVVYDGTSFHGQTITNTSNAQVTYDGSSFSHSYSNGTLTITSTGAYFQPCIYIFDYSYSGTAANVHTADVQVGSGATSITFTGLEGEPIYWSCIFKSNFATSSGYQRVIWVDSCDNQVIGCCMDSGSHTGNQWTASYNNGSLTISSNGTNQGGYFHQPGYYQLTYALAEASPYQTKSVTYTPTTSQQTANITADTGYDALSQVNVTVNAMPTMTLPSSASATSSGTSKATITPGSSVQYLNIPTGYNGTAQYYTIGASGGGGTLTVATKTLTNTAVSQTLSFTSLSGQPKYWFCRVTSNVSSSGSTTYYYITDCFYDGTSVKGNTFRIGSTRRVQNVTSGISQSYSGGTLTITAGSSSGATPGQFYGASGIGYELVYIY